MKFKKISPALWVSPQIEVADVARLAEMGVRSIVNNRPDGESDDQPDSESLARAAAVHGLDYRHIPVVPGKLDDGHVTAFRRARQTLTGPVLAFCRTGTRAITLWALSEAQQLDADAIVATAVGRRRSINSIGLSSGAQQKRQNAMCGRGAAVDVLGVQA